MSEQALRNTADDFSLMVLKYRSQIQEGGNDGRTVVCIFARSGICAICGIQVQDFHVQGYPISNLEDGMVL